MRTADDDRAAEVFGLAIAEAVRRAVKDVGVDRLGGAVDGNGDIIDLRETTSNGRSVEPLDPYQVLGVSPRATWEEIITARNRLLRECHPDAGGDEERLLTLNAAFAELRIRRAR